MKTWAKYLLLTVAFAILASGVVISAFMDVAGNIGLKVLWLIVPTTAMFMVTAVLHDRLLVPYMLMRQRFPAYMFSTLAISYLGAYMSIWMECLMRNLLDLPHRIADYNSRWILVDTFSSGMLLFLILLCLGIWSLYDRWKLDLETEKRYTDALNQYIRTVRRRFNSDYILACVDYIIERVRVNTDDAIEGIHRLSDYLRKQLYELPSPPVPSAELQTDPLSCNNRLTDWLVGKKYRPLRHLLFLVLLPVISFTVFFNAPDEPVFTVDRIMSFILMFLILDILAYVNILWLYRRFRRHRNVGRYIMEIGIMILLLMSPMIFGELLTYDANVMDKNLPVVLVIISTTGTALTLLFFVGGIGALMMLQDWVNGQRRMVLLHARTVRQEYLYLRKQINPHFLFNVLNNAGILSDEDPDAAVEMLTELKQLLVYQFAETDQPRTSLKREIDFLKSYLRLEATRIEPFEFEISASSDLDSRKVPTLLFMPFVENAVKYSTVVNSRRSVGIRFTDMGERLEFRCVNTFGESSARNVHSGGIGLANTRRRLELLYGSDFTLEQHTARESYIVTLTIPFYYQPYEMYYS